MTEYCFLNGKILPLAEAKVGVEDIGLLRGYGIYDGLAAFDGKPFHFTDHWNRFLSGAHILNLSVPVTEEKAERMIEEIVVKSSYGKRANVRLILTGGKTLNGIEYNFEDSTFYIIAEKWESLPQDYYENGAKLITHRHMRELPEYKTINYIRAVNLQDFRKKEKAVEILYTYDSEILECATSNIFIVKNGILITPAENILKGITRKVVLELARLSLSMSNEQAEKISTQNELILGLEECPVTEEELKTADEVFITSSFKDIVPIVKIDNFEIGNGQVGPITRDLMVKFAKIISSQIIS